MKGRKRKPEVDAAARRAIRDWTQATGQSLWALCTAVGLVNGTSKSVSRFLEGGALSDATLDSVLRGIERWPQGWTADDEPPLLAERRRAERRERAARCDAREAQSPRLTDAEIAAGREAVAKERRARALHWLAQEKPPLNGKPIGHRPIEDMVA